MRQAIRLAESVMYLTAPNPRVACLIVRDGRLLASGATQRAGGPHAEVMALRQAAERGIDVRGCTVYVTLEPCSHFGRTPPCVDALIAARPARVVIAMRDPNPLVGGQGIARLQAAGISVTLPVCPEEALALNPGFAARMSRKTPWAWLKLASSIDGRIALPNGQSKWITGAAARADGHHWRARSCVVLTGSGTLQADDPQMNVRHVETERPPIKAVVDTRFEVDEGARIFDGTETWVFTCRPDREKADRLADRNVRVIQLPPSGKRVDLQAMMQWLGEHDVNEVHIEAGARLSGALLDAGCVDELLVYVAPMLLGEGIGMVNMARLDDLSQAQPFEFIDTHPVGPDLRLRARHVQHWNTLLQAVGI
ncbi:bifunctional diaminohydroxyphosphoribosylaminopyrimidine deaminase/5-amino-6-(5-phosphoribosylamino)uracil reductase RibD [Parapusillimonas granuli]|uniref:Riboflavin biosynthesis protein RibD n=2 Tax=Parapusillimonas granuli TaxID=380911 RepID=A0A853FXT4_9BURK|nr:bifunctional diaminohydroxyphosphoribosylaminopyrimidine deaminase/5-amino-6-(5-phosphoribosylamino)uracil reductase RibD [Parapusillimonas granuli]MEB2399443.1 bifunctional diaminohydroxyphosphoribosylaminopyrimidine deaminase/5-amino-6-(5-phosphoribosylamino)uracil reductase RibD [Alcaligenaceae bacterium]NYT50835.1 bifunctional diaminohydroxyphosphoribosylaminopyrimidine deaminase/5-amino-6-(5-phosphoribosylamino)uracil reductase RibD [Parapusillimonas granuli]